MKKFFVEGCLHVSLFGYGFPETVYLRVTTNTQESLNRAIKFFFKNLLHNYAKRQINLCDFQLCAIKLYLYHYGQVKAALCGHDGGKNFGGLKDPDRDLLIGEVEGADCFGKGIDLREVSSRSFESWCQALLDQLNGIGNGELTFDVAMDHELQTKAKDDMHKFKLVAGEAELFASGAADLQALDTAIHGRWDRKQLVGLVCRTQASNRKAMNLYDAEQLIKASSNMLDEFKVDGQTRVELVYNSDNDACAYCVTHSYAVLAKTKVGSTPTDVLLAAPGDYMVTMSKGRTMCSCQTHCSGWREKSKSWCVHKLFIVQTKRLDVTPLDQAYATQLKQAELVKKTIDARKWRQGQTAFGNKGGRHTGTNTEKDLKAGVHFEKITASAWKAKLIEIGAQLEGGNTFVEVRVRDTVVVKRKIIKHAFLQAFHFTGSTKKMCGACDTDIQKYSPRLVRLFYNTEWRARDTNDGSAVPNKVYKGSIEKCNTVDYVACCLKVECIRGFPKDKGGKFETVIVTKDTKQWMELPLFTYANHNLYGTFGQTEIDVVHKDSIILQHISDVATEVESGTTVGQGGDMHEEEYASEDVVDVDVEENADAVAPTEEETGEVQVVGAFKEHPEDVKFLVHWCHTEGYTDQIRCTFQSYEDLNREIKWLAVHDRMMEKKEGVAHEQSIHGLATNWIDLMFDTGGVATQKKIYRVLTVAADGWATVEPQTTAMRKSGEKVYKVNFETLEWEGGAKTVVEWCQKGYDVESPQAQP